MKPKQGACADNKCRATPKRVAKINDQAVPMLDRLVSETVLRAQSGVPDDHLIVRDHNDPNDPLIPRGAEVDLAAGSVFYSLPECDVKPDRGSCHAAGKHVLTVDDRPATVLRLQQTARSIRDLFRIASDHDLFVDLESATDDPIGDSDEVDLADGNVFITRRHKGLTITVNSQKFTTRDGVKQKMTGRQIAALVFPDSTEPKVKKIVGSAKEEVPLDNEIDIQDCDEFRVIRSDVNAGFQASRIDREVGLLVERGVDASVSEGSPSAVVYRGLSVARGTIDYVTDVLVLIPDGYPAGAPDNAFLPADSPLLGMTVGAQQEMMLVDGKAWVKKSVHPYLGPNGSRWDQRNHGFHTYYNEVLSWLHA